MQAGRLAAELVPEDVASMWGLKTHGLMKDVLLQEGEISKAIDQGGRRQPVFPPRHGATVVNHIFLLGTYGFCMDLGSNLRCPTAFLC